MPSSLRAGGATAAAAEGACCPAALAPLLPRVSYGLRRADTKYIVGRLSVMFAMDAFGHPWAYLTSNRFRREGFKGLAWLNCEFGSIPEWACKCRDESQAGGNILLLTPAALGANWFSKYIAKHADVYLLKPRIPFIPGKPFNRDCMLSHFVDPKTRSTGPYTVEGTEGLEDKRLIAIWNWQTGETTMQWTAQYPGMSGK